MNKLTSRNDSNPPLYKDWSTWLEASLDGTARTAKHMSPLYQIMQETYHDAAMLSINRAIEMARMSHEVSHEMSYWNARRNMAVRSANFNLIQSERYGRFWSVTDKLKHLGKVSTALDVGLRAEKIIKAAPDQRGRVAFEQSATFVLENIVDVGVASAVESTTGGLGILILIPALAIVNHVIDQSQLVKKYSDITYNMFIGK